MYDRTVQRARLIGPGVLVAAVFAAGTAFAQTPELSGPAKPFDTNGNGVIERNEAQGPAAVNFDTIDLNNSGSLDGDELRQTEIPPILEIEASAVKAADMMTQLQYKELLSRASSRRI